MIGTESMVEALGSRTRTHVEPLELSWSLIHLLVCEILKGKTLYRTLMNHTLSGIEITGNVIDLGSGAKLGSYYRFLKWILPVNLTRVDLHDDGENLLKLDLELPLGLDSDSYDFVLCFETLEHVYNYQNVIRESYRILKPGGTFIGSTPFAYPYHQCPNDYFRFSHQAIADMFEQAGYENGGIISICLGPFSLSFVQLEAIMPRIIKLPLALISILLGIIFKRVTKSGIGDYIVRYVYMFHKAGQSALLDDKEEHDKRQGLRLAR